MRRLAGDGSGLRFAAATMRWKYPLHTLQIFSSLSRALHKATVAFLSSRDAPRRRMRRNPISTRLFARQPPQVAGSFFLPAVVLRLGILGWCGHAQCPRFGLPVLAMTPKSGIGILRNMPSPRFFIALLSLALVQSAANGSELAPDASASRVLTPAEEVRLFCGVVSAAARVVVSARDRGVAQADVEDAMRENGIVGVNRTLLRDVLEVIDFAYGTGRDTEGAEIERFVTGEWCEGQLLGR